MSRQLMIGMIVGFVSAVVLVSSFGRTKPALKQPPDAGPEFASARLPDPPMFMVHAKALMFAEAGDAGVDGGTR